MFRVVVWKEARSYDKETRSCERVFHIKQPSLMVKCWYNTKVTKDEIIQTVCKEYGLDMGDFLQVTRGRLRTSGIYLSCLREIWIRMHEEGFSVNRIAEAFSKNHSTILFGLRKTGRYTSRGFTSLPYRGTVIHKKKEKEVTFANEHKYDYIFNEKRVPNRTYKEILAEEQKRKTDRLFKRGNSPH